MNKPERIKGIEEGQASLAVKPLYLASRKMIGRVVQPLKVQAHRPLIA